MIKFCILSNTHNVLWLWIIVWYCCEHFKIALSLKIRHQTPNRLIKLFLRDFGHTCTVASMLWLLIVYSFLCFALALGKDKMCVLVNIYLNTIMQLLYLTWTSPLPLGISVVSSPLLVFAMLCNTASHVQHQLEIHNHIEKFCIIL